MSNTNHAQYFIIPIDIVDETQYENALDNKNEHKKLFNKITNYAIAQKWPIKHGDLARFQYECGVISDTADYDIFIEMKLIKNGPDYIKKIYNDSSNLKKISLTNNKRSTTRLFSTVNSNNELHDIESDDQVRINFKNSTEPSKKSILVRAETAESWNLCGKFIGYYRNEGLIIWNKDHFEDLDYSIDDYGSLPQDYILYTEPYYFEEKHWHDNDHKTPEDIELNKKLNKKYTWYTRVSNTPCIDAYISHNDYVWIHATDEMVSNAQTKLIQKEHEEKNIYVHFTHWNDCRGKTHYLIYDNDETTDIKEFTQRLSDIILCNVYSENLYNLNVEKLGLKLSDSIIYMSSIEL